MTPTNSHEADAALANIVPTSTVRGRVTRRPADRWWSWPSVRPLIDGLPSSALSPPVVHVVEERRLGSDEWPAAPRSCPGRRRRGRGPLEGVATPRVVGGGGATPHRHRDGGEDRRRTPRAMSRAPITPTMLRASTRSSSGGGDLELGRLEEAVDDIGTAEQQRPTGKIQDDQTSETGRELGSPDLGRPEPHPGDRGEDRREHHEGQHAGARAAAAELEGLDHPGHTGRGGGQQQETALASAAMRWTGRETGERHAATASAWRPHRRSSPTPGPRRRCRRR